MHGHYPRNITPSARAELYRVSVKFFRDPSGQSSSSESAVDTDDLVDLLIGRVALTGMTSTVSPGFCATSSAHVRARLAALDGSTLGVGVRTAVLLGRGGRGLSLSEVAGLDRGVPPACFTNSALLLAGVVLRFTGGGEGVAAGAAGGAVEGTGSVGR